MRGLPKFFLPDSRYYSEKWGDEELDLLSRLVYHPLYGLVYRHRYRMAFSLVPETENCLEIGCGYGQFLPALSKRAKELYAVDIHPHMGKVSGVLGKSGLREARLSRGDILHLPYKDNSFGTIVCLSVLEQMEDIDNSTAELKRVLKAGGALIAGFPMKNRLTRALFKLIGRDDDVIHPQSHSSLIASLEKHFEAAKRRVFPRYTPLDFGLYFVGEYVKRDE